MHGVKSYGLLKSKNMQDGCQFAEPSTVTLSAEKCGHGQILTFTIRNTGRILVLLKYHFKIRNQNLKHLRFALVKCNTQYKYAD